MNQRKDWRMTAGMRTIMYPVADLDAAKGLYGALFGVEPYMDEPYYVGYNVADQNIGLDPNGHSKGMSGPTGYWHVDDIKAALDGLVARGAAKVQEINDVGGGKLIATAQDADGNVIGLLQMP
jgi:predicted enzyme related to lactoylglutathione lyase